MQLTEELVDIQKRLGTLPCRVVPTSFESDDSSLTGFPLPRSWRWSTCQEALARLSPMGVMMRLPLFWQMEFPLWQAARSVGAPIFLNDPENMPVGAAALRRGGMDTVVTEARDAIAFSLYLDAEERIRPRHWMVVHRAEDDWAVPKASLREPVVQEVHLMPGVPILTQCTLLAEAAEPRFHQIEGYAYDWEARILSIPARESIPGFSLPLPAVEESGTCSCGLAVYQRAI